MLAAMNQLIDNGYVILRTVVFLFLPLVGSAQEAGKAKEVDSAAAARTGDKIDLAQTQAAWEAIESDAAVEAAVKDLIRPKFKAAIEDLQQAGQYQDASTTFRGSIESAPVEAATKRAEASQLPTEQQASRITETFDSIEDLQRSINARTASLESRSDELDKVQTELRGLEEERPSWINTRIPEIQTELSKTRSNLQVPELSEEATSLGRIADRTVLLARQAKLEAELEMLKQEKLSLSAREDLLEARANWLTRLVANETSAINTLKQQEQERLEREAKRAGNVIQSSKDSIPQNDIAAQQLVQEVQALAELFDTLVSQNANVNAAQSEVSETLKTLDEDYERLSRELAVEGAGATMAQMAFDLQESLIASDRYGLANLDSLPTLESMRLNSIQVGKGLRDQASVEVKFANHQSFAIDQLLSTRKELLDKLQSRYKRMIPAMIKLEASRKQLANRNEEVHKSISEQLVWIRSSPPLKFEDLTSLPTGLRWLFSVDHWLEFRSALGQAYRRTPFRFLGVLSLLMVLLAFRPRIIRSLEATGQATRRISTDRYGLSWEALIWTILLAAPLSIALFFLAWVFSTAASTSVWMRGLADGAPNAARIALLLAFACELCRPGGLGNAHFRWQQTTLDALRRTLFQFGIVYIPAGLILSSTLYGEASSYCDGIGRVSIIFSKLWTCFLIWRHLGGKHGLVARMRTTQPNRLLTQTRWIWYPLLLLFPLTLGVLAARGYVIAARALSVGFAETIGIVFYGEIVYWMVLRWFSLKQRTLAVAERMERLRAAREAANCEPLDESTTELAITPEDEPLLDLDTIASQTRRLVRSLISVGMILTVIWVWSATFPLGQTLSTIQIPLTDGVDLFELLKALLIMGVTAVIVKNLPGVLELSVLRASPVDSGTSYAITTLCRYAIAAVGTMAVFNVLKFDWTKFGWMAAALGVGIGFGLQEVITNFVCGLILLFERPVRLGDVVTIQGVTGTVTRIRMRATTITNYDRQEFVVPNKSLITDTILNWTLSASVSRIVINVGVAYGTDTDQARQILTEVANDHPIVMKDPSPSATFEQFADSTLNLCLRCYVPDLDHRLRTISDLHTQIGHRFAESGIEIAFPQQDIHIRSGLEVFQNMNRTNMTKPA